MKKSIPKIVIALLISLGAYGKTTAQTTDTGIHAFFKGTEAEIKNNITSNHLVFFVSGLISEKQVSDFEKKSQAYAKSFTMTIVAEINGQRECKINFIGIHDMKWILRFFMASSIADVDQGNSKKSVNDFFKPYM